MVNSQDGSRTVVRNRLKEEQQFGVSTPQRWASAGCSASQASSTAAFTSPAKLPFAGWHFTTAAGTGGETPEQTACVRPRALTNFYPDQIFWVFADRNHQLFPPAATARQHSARSIWWCVQGTSERLYFLSFLLCKARKCIYRPKALWYVPYPLNNR